MGEDASYAYESTADYRKEVLAITGAYGKQIDLLDETTGAYKSTYQILKELSAVWDDIDDAGKQSLLYTLGGARQVNVLSAILKNFDDAKKVVEELSNAQGSALAENEKYLDSIMGKWSQVQASFQELSSTTVDSELVKFMLDFANVTLKAADNLMELTGLFPLLISGATSYIRATEGKDFLLYNGDFSLGNLMKPLDSRKDQSSQQIGNIWGHLNIQKNRYINDAAELKKLLSVLGTFDSKATNSLERSEKFMAKIVDHSTTMSETTQGILATRLKLANTDKEAVNILSESVDQLDNAATKAKSFGQILGGALKGMVVAAAISLAIKGISMAVDAAITTVEERREKIQEYTDALEAAEGEILKLRELEQNGVGITEADKARLDYLIEYTAAIRDARKEEQKLLDVQDLLKGDFNPFSDNSYEQRQNTLRDSSSSELLVAAYRAQDNPEYADHEKLRELHSNSILTRADLLSDKESLVAAMERADEEFKDDFQIQIDIIDKKIAQIDEDLANVYATGVISGREGYDIPVTETTYNKRSSWNIFQDYEGKNVATTFEGKTTTVKVDFDSDDAEAKAERFKQILKDVQETSFSEINAEIDNTQSAIETVTKAATEYNSMGAFSIDTLQALTELDGRYLDLLVDEAGNISLNTEKIRELTNARINELRVKAIVATTREVEALVDEAAAVDKLAEAEIGLGEASLDEANAALQSAVATIYKKAADEGWLSTAEDVVALLYQRLNVQLENINALSMYGSALDDTAQKEQDLLRKQGDAILKHLDNKKKPLEAEKKALDKKKEALQDELDALNEIYEAEDKEFELQKRKDAYERAKANKTVRLYTHDKGWQWVADPTEVKEAEDAYNEYLKEIERDSVKKAIEDQIDAIEDAKDAIDEEIDKIDELKDKVNDAMNDIGKTYDEHAEELALMAELEGMTYDQLGDYINDYAQKVVDSYAKMTEAVKKYYAAAGKEEYNDTSDTPTFKKDNYHSAGYYEAKYKQEAAKLAAEKAEDDKKKATQAYINRMEQKGLKYHTGGFVKGISSTANVSPAFRQYMSNLERNEVPAILEAGEFVLTKNHQKAILDNNTALVNSSSSARNISLEIGDVIVQNPVGNVETLSTAIIRQLPNQILRDLYNK